MTEINSIWKKKLCVKIARWRILSNIIFMSKISPNLSSFPFLWFKFRLLSQFLFTSYLLETLFSRYNDILRCRWQEFDSRKHKTCLLYSIASTLFLSTSWLISNWQWGCFLFDIPAGMWRSPLNSTNCLGQECRSCNSSLISPHDEVLSA
jgi:hypothetical protein